MDSISRDKVPTCPAVSQMWSLTTFPSSSLIVFVFCTHHIHTRQCLLDRQYSIGVLPVFQKCSYMQVTCMLLKCLIFPRNWDTTSLTQKPATEPGTPHDPGSRTHKVNAHSRGEALRVHVVSKPLQGLQLH